LYTEAHFGVAENACLLGWHISVYRQTNDGSAPAAVDSAKGVRVAVWQAGWRGLRWIDELVEARKAIDLGGNGYPCRYTVTARHLVPNIIEAPPEVRPTWVAGGSDILTGKWEGKTVIDHAAAGQCRPDEWLLVEAWDES